MVLRFPWIIRRNLPCCWPVHALHPQGVCHGDLKLSNCLLARAPMGQQALQQHAQLQGPHKAPAGAGARADAPPDLPVDDDGSDSLAGWVPKV